MSRNENTRFALNPTSLDMSRSTFRRDHSVKLSYNVGDVIPFYVDEILPGDTFQVRTSMVARLQTLLTPIIHRFCSLRRLGYRTFRRSTS